jgi:predicted MPP superfamily phosphohydrolase
MPDYLDALRLLEALPTRLGSYCSLGNHEYIRGVRRVRGLFEQTSLPLLVDSGQAIDVNGTPLYIAAADDPRYLRSEESYTRLRTSVEKSMDSAPQEAFSILMSHRSQALDYASPLGIDLVLAGHTHGFQLGLGGRSLFDSLLPDRYIWGQYNQGQSQLYTTCGVGHWLPFRFGCPPEAPLIVLHKA